MFLGDHFFVMQSHPRETGRWCWVGEASRNMDQTWDVMTEIQKRWNVGLWKTANSGSGWTVKKKTAPVCSRSWWLFGPMRLQRVYSDTVIPQCPQQRHGGNFAVCILGLAGDLAIMLYHVLPCFTPMFIVNLLVKWRNHRKPSTGWIWLRKSWFRIKIALNWGYTPFIKSHQPSLN